MATVQALIRDVERQRALLEPQLRLINSSFVTELCAQRAIVGRAVDLVNASHRASVQRAIDFVNASQQPSIQQAMEVVNAFQQAYLRHAKDSLDAYQRAVTPDIIKLIKYMQVSGYFRTTSTTRTAEPTTEPPSQAEESSPATAENLKFAWASAFRPAMAGPGPTAQEKDELICTLRIAVLISCFMMTSVFPWLDAGIQRVIDSAELTKYLFIVLVTMQIGRRS